MARKPSYFTSKRQSAPAVASTWASVASMGGHTFSSSPSRVCAFPLAREGREARAGLAEARWVAVAVRRVRRAGPRVARWPDFTDSGCSTVTS